MLQLRNPFASFQGLDGLALDEGYVYIGEPNADPETDPIAVFWDEDLTDPAAQPLRTGAGLIENTGTPARVYAAEDSFSIRVRNKQGVQVFYVADWSGIVTLRTLAYLASANGAVSRSAYSKLGDVLSVKDFGAVGDGVTDDTAAIQAAIDSLSFNQGLYFPSTPNSFYKVTSTLLIPSLGGLNFFGDGKTASRIRLVNGGSSVDLFARADTSPLEANNINYCRFADMGFEATGASRHGINWLSMSRSLVQGCWFTGFAGAGMLVTSSLSGVVRDTVFVGCGDGLQQTTTGWTGMNGWTFSGNYISVSTRLGMDIQAGMVGAAIMGCIFESNGAGGAKFAQDSHAVSFDGCYFENNKTAALNTSDIYIGSGAACSAFGVRNCYFDGDTTADDFFYPIRLGQAQSCVIENNILARGSKFIKFEAIPTDCTIGKVALQTGNYKSSDQAQATLNFAAGVIEFFCQSRNRLTHDFHPSAQPQYPLDLVPAEDLVTDWVTTLTGGSSYTATTNGKRVAYALTRAGGGTAQIVKSLTVSDTSNPEVRQRFVTFAVDVLVNNAAAKQFTLTLDDGTAGQQESYSASRALGDSYQTFYITLPFSSPTTAVRMTIAANDDAEYRLCNARWYVSADPEGIT